MTIILKKQIEVTFSFVFLVIDNEFRQNNVKVVGGSTPLSPRGFTVTFNVMTKFRIKYRTDV